MAVGDLITAARYNALQTRIETIFGNGSGTDGYGQSVASSQVSIGNTVTATDINNIISDMQKARTHQVGSTISTITSVAVGDLIAEDTSTDPDGVKKGIADFEAAMTTIETDKLLVDAGETTAGAGISDDRTTPWNGTISHEVRITFASEDARRHFFNTGGEIRTSASITGGAGAKTTDWQTMLSNMGTIKMNYTETTATGTGSGSAIGFVDLTGTYQTIFTKSGSGVYAENDYIVQARAATTTTVDIRIYWQDDDTGDQTGLGPAVDEDVDGTLTSNVDFLRASGSNVSVAAPTFANVVTF